MAKAGYVIYKRCVAGDRRKVEADSNENPSQGGGARDLRFNPLDMFESVVAEVFPETRTGGVGGTVNYTPVYWWERGEVCGPIIVELWSPTDSRGGEVRLSRVHEVTPFDQEHLPEPEEDPFFLLWTDDDGKAWARYVTVAQLRQPGWSSLLVDPILESVEEVKATQNIRGWIDLRTGKGERKDVRRR